MRPPAEKQDPLRTPLNDVFRSQGNVRVLRVLAFADEPIGRTTVARRARLNPSGVRRTLDQLADLGLVEGLGSGRNLSVRIRERHPLAQPIRTLFREERRVFEAFRSAAERAFHRSDFAATAVWIENPEARSPGTVHLGVLAPPDRVDEARDVVRNHLEEIGQELAIHFVVHGYSDADRAALTDQESERLRQLTLLYGWLPREWRDATGGPVRSHRHLDERGRRLAEAVADQLPRDPSIIDRTLEWIDERLENADGRAAHDLQEWRQVLSDLSIQQIQSLLREESDRADRLRQSLPFVEVLAPEERTRLLEEAGS